MTKKIWNFHSLEFLFAYLNDLDHFATKVYIDTFFAKFVTPPSGPHIQK